MTAADIAPILEKPLLPARPRIAMVSSALPPLLDGIGDYTSRLASAFSTWADVTIHSSCGFSPDPIPNVSIQQSFDMKPRRAVSGLISAVDRNPPDALILQYNPFCFGNKGFNPHLPVTIQKLKNRDPRLHLTTMVHERFMPANSPRNLVMWAYQFAQFRAITAFSDLTLFSTGPWFDAYRRNFPARASGHIPVGSNLPFVPADRARIRAELKLPNEAIVLGSFGGDHPSRLFHFLAAAGRALVLRKFDARVLSIGSAGASIRSAMPELPVIDLGKLSAEDVSRNLQAVDIYCSPFFDGVSTRRGSFFAGLQHGLATVTCRAYNTDDDLMSHSGRAFLATNERSESAFTDAVCALAEDAERRRAMGAAAKACFDANYSVNVLANRWRDHLMKPLLQPHE